MRLGKVMRIGNVAKIQMKVNDHTPELIKHKDELVQIALEIIGTKCADYAAMNLERNPRRVDTGRLKNSLTHEVVPDEAMVEIGTNVEYAVYVEYGTGKYASNGGGRSTPWLFQDSKGEFHITSGMKPNHFLRDALQDHKKEYKEIAEAVLDGKL